MDIQKDNPAQNDDNGAKGAGARQDTDGVFDGEMLNGFDNPSDEYALNRQEKARRARHRRKDRRNQELDQIQNSKGDNAEIQLIMNQTDKNKEGAVCTILFTFCFIVHFLLEVGGHWTGSQYSMQNVLSKHFETSTINMDQYREKQLFEGQDESKVGDPTTPDGTILQDLMTIKDIKRVDQLKVFTEFTINQLYPEVRSSSDESSFFTYDKEYDHEEDSTDIETNQDGGGDSNDEEEADDAAVTSVDEQGQDGTVTADTTADDAPKPFKMTMINSFNYFCGMKISIREAKMETNFQNQAKRVITKIKPGSVGSSNNEGQDEKETYSYYFKGDLSREDALAELKTLNAKFQKSRSQPMTNFEFKMAFYNQNDKLGVILNMDFSMSNGGQILYQKSSGIFKPQNYEWNDHTHSFNFFKVVLLVFWSIYWLIFFIYAFVDLLLTVKLFLVKRQFELDWFKYIEYWLLIMCLLVLLYWFDIFFGENQENFELPMDEATFNKMDRMSSQIRRYSQYSAIIAILLMTKNLRTLTSKFPAFGVLFETISAAKVDLLYFTIIFICMISAFAIIFYCLFGPNDHLFSSLPSAAISILQMLFGRNLFPQLDRSNPDASIIFFVLFSILFYFIILNVYAAIVMRTYDNLRQKKQLMTEAMADIFAKQAEEQSNKIRNILFCQMKRVQLDESDASSESEEAGYQEEDNGLSAAENKRQRKIREAMQKQQQKEEEEAQAGLKHTPSIQKRIMFNIGTLQELLNPNANQMSVQVLQKKLKAAKIKIVRKKFRQREDRIQKFGGVADKSSYVQLRNSVIFVGFISIYSSMLDYQHETLPTSEMADMTNHSLQDILKFIPYKKYCSKPDPDQNPASYDCIGDFNYALPKVIKDDQVTEAAESGSTEDAADTETEQTADASAKPKKGRILSGFTWANITQVGDIQDFLSQPLFNYWHERERYNLGEHNIIMGNEGKHPETGVKYDEIARIMINFHNEIPNLNDLTNTVFSNQTQVWSTYGLPHLNMSVPENLGGQGGPNVTRTDNFNDTDSGLEFIYFENALEDKFMTDQGHSGYLFSISADKAKALETVKKLYKIDFSKKFQRIAQINIDFVLFNVHYDIYQYVQIQFWIDGAGGISKKMKLTKAEIDHFETSNETEIDKKKTNCLVVEVFFLMFVLFETYKIYKILRDEWDFLTSLEQQQRNQKRRNNEESAFIRFLLCIQVDTHRIDEQNCAVVFVNIVKGICLTAFSSVLKIVQLIINILKKSFFYFLDMISIVLMYTQIAIWGKIIKKGSFLTDQETGTPVNIIQVCGGVSDYFETYSIVCTISIAVIFIRVLQYFTFSKKLSAFSEIMAAAALDILFFAIMWFVMVSGFAIAFFAVYGREIETHSSIGQSLFNTLKMSMNEFQFDQMEKADAGYTIPVFIIFVAIFKLLLGNMFIAIISAHYFQFQREAAEDSHGEEDANFFDLIFSIIRSKIKQEQQNDAEDIPDDDAQGGGESKKQKKKKELGYIKAIKLQLIKYFLKIDILDIMPDEEDAEERQERNEETTRHRSAFQSGANPDILDYQGNNQGLKPFILNLTVAKQGPQALRQAQINREALLKQQAAMQKTQFSALDLVNSNLWLQILEQRLQKISQAGLSLYDFQNQDTVYSSLIEQFTLDNLIVIQKQLLKVTPTLRMDFIKKKIRIYDGPDKTSSKEPANGQEASNSEDLEAPAAAQEQPPASAETRTYTSQIDYIYLMWKALEFEHLYDSVNVEEKDQILQLFDFMNNQSKEKEKTFEEQQMENENQGDHQNAQNEHEWHKEQEKMRRAKKIAEESVIKYQFLIQSKIMTDRQFNRVTELQHKLWTTVLDHYERHCLWFHLFDTLDRVRLWNSLVFSDGYFRLLSNSSKYKRQDLNKYFRENITLKVRKDEENEIRILNEKREAPRQKAPRRANPGQEDDVDPKAVKLSAEKEQEIRDRHYTPKVMLKMWNMIKQRQYEVDDTDHDKDEKEKAAQPEAEKQGHDQAAGEGNKTGGKGSHGHGAHDGDEQTKTKTMEMNKKEFMDMIRSLFKIMIHGVSHDRLRVLMQEALNRGSITLNLKKVSIKAPQNAQERNKEGGSNVEFEIYKRLVDETYDASEYRLPLWLPLSLEQKLDMLLHQRIDEEVEMMQFLIDEELGCGQNYQAFKLKQYVEVDKMLERALDALIFEKYMTLTRMQAINASNKMCDDRISNHTKEDDQLMTYTNFLIDKSRDAAKTEADMRAGIVQRQRINAMLVKKIGQQMTSKMDSSRLRHQQEQ